MKDSSLCLVVSILLVCVLGQGAGDPNSGGPSDGPPIGGGTPPGPQPQPTPLPPQSPPPKTPPQSPQPTPPNTPPPTHTPPQTPQQGAPQTPQPTPQPTPPQQQPPTPPQGSPSPTPGVPSPTAGQSCQPVCASGYFSSVTPSPVSCNSGSYSDTCSACPAGSSCSSPSSLPLLCSAGTYAHAAATTCTSCPPGYKCPSSGISAPSPCIPGHYALGGATVCTPCAAGTACSSTTSSASTPCGVGTYATEGMGVCAPCPAGHECPSTSQSVPCLPGSYSTGSQTACTPCPPGRACPFTDRDLQLPCGSGTFSTGSQTQCSLCPAGSTCPDATGASQPPCGRDEFSLPGSVSCSPRCEFSSCSECASAGCVWCNETSASKLHNSSTCGRACPAGSLSLPGRCFSPSAHDALSSYFVHPSSSPTSLTSFLRLNDSVVGSTLDFAFALRNALGDILPLFHVDARLEYVGSSVRTPLLINHLGGGSYGPPGHMITRSGTYRVHVDIPALHPLPSATPASKAIAPAGLPQSPFTAVFMPANVAPSNCVFVNRVELASGIAPGGVTVVVRAFDAFGNPQQSAVTVFEVEVISFSGETVTSAVSQQQSGLDSHTFHCAFNLTSAGEYRYRTTVTADGLPPSTPLPGVTGNLHYLVVRPGPTHAPSCSLEVEPGVSGEPGDVVDISIRARDSFSNAQTSGTDAFFLLVDGSPGPAVTYSGQPGLYQAKLVRPSVEGYAMLDCRLGDASLPGSPIALLSAFQSTDVTLLPIPPALQGSLPPPAPTLPPAPKATCPQPALPEAPTPPVGLLVVVVLLAIVVVALALFLCRLHRKMRENKTVHPDPTPGPTPFLPEPKPDEPKPSPKLPKPTVIAPLPLPSPSKYDADDNKKKPLPAISGSQKGNAADETGSLVSFVLGKMTERDREALFARQNAERALLVERHWTRAETMLEKINQERLALLAQQKAEMLAKFSEASKANIECTVQDRLEEMAAQKRSLAELRRSVELESFRAEEEALKNLFKQKIDDLLALQGLHITQLKQLQEAELDVTSQELQSQLQADNKDLDAPDYREKRDAAAAAVVAHKHKLLALYLEEISELINRYRLDTRSMMMRDHSTDRQQLLEEGHLEYLTSIRETSQSMGSAQERALQTERTRLALELTKFVAKGGSRALMEESHHKLLAEMNEAFENEREQVLNTQKAGLAMSLVRRQTIQQHRHQWELQLLQEAELLSEYDCVDHERANRMQVATISAEAASKTTALTDADRLAQLMKDSQGLSDAQRQRMLDEYYSSVEETQRTLDAARVAQLDDLQKQLLLKKQRKKKQLSDQHRREMQDLLEMQQGEREQQMEQLDAADAAELEAAVAAEEMLQKKLVLATAENNEELKQKLIAEYNNRTGELEGLLNVSQSEQLQELEARLKARRATKKAQQDLLREERKRALALINEQEKGRLVEPNRSSETSDSEASTVEDDDREFQDNSHTMAEEVNTKKEESIASQRRQQADALRELVSNSSNDVDSQQKMAALLDQHSAGVAAIEREFDRVLQKQQEELAMQLREKKKKKQALLEQKRKEEAAIRDENEEQALNAVEADQKKRLEESFAKASQSKRKLAVIARTLNLHKESREDGMDLLNLQERLQSEFLVLQTLLTKEQQAQHREVVAKLQARNKAAKRPTPSVTADSSRSKIASEMQRRVAQVEKAQESSQLSHSVHQELNITYSLTDLNAALKSVLPFLEKSLSGKVDAKVLQDTLTDFVSSLHSTLKSTSITAASTVPMSARSSQMTKQWERRRRQREEDAVKNARREGKQMDAGYRALVDSGYE